MRVLLTGWPSFLHGEATAGDVLSMNRIQSALVGAEVAWSQVFRLGTLGLDQADPELYTHLVFICGPVHGEQVRSLHERFSRCRRIAVRHRARSVRSGGHRFRCGTRPRHPGRAGRRDLAATALTERVPVVGVVVLAPSRHEYGERRRHDEVHRQITGWLVGRDCALVPVDTRLDPRHWLNHSTPDQLDSVLRRLDAVLTTRLHGLVLALRHAVPALAVDPVSGGGKASAQAVTWGWPALVTADEVLRDADCLRPWWSWCLVAEGRMSATERAADAAREGDRLASDLLRVLQIPVEA